ncbi:hypothetical protein BDN70DRAFT_817039 [Pholiota conissans]|uniref:Uncharacterized protein n=1 Tax=Pholiota conissans TaxID=109636 RepID=A0A9P5YRT8_9AGAR|nr:hypothetical protein BDN70DRAFT_817039 [Pholiota conissans]
MHLIWENLIKNLVLHWTGEFKGLGEGSGSYILENSAWKAVGIATAASGSTIPSAFGSRVPNIVTDATLCTADMWSFWTLYLGPALLRRRFRKPKYFKHFVQLVRLLTTCLQYEISKEEISDLRTGFIQWVQGYEEMYYQFSAARLSACPLTIHALLHIADSIEMCGPVWCYWAFPMERYCGKLHPALRSRRFPYAALDRFVLEDAQLTQIKLISGLTDELSLRTPKQLMPGVFHHPSYKDFILLPACRTGELTPGLMTGIISAIATRINSSNTQTIRKYVNSAAIEQWAKVRCIDSEEGDTMWASSLKSGQDDSRDATFVRYQMLVDINERHRRQETTLELQTFYGQLQHIIVLKFQDPLARCALGFAASDLDTDVIILAAIRECTLGPSNPSLHGLDVHFYSTMGARRVVDLTCVQCVVGRVPVMDDEWDWAIIDRSGSLVRAVQAMDGVNS